MLGSNKGYSHRTGRILRISITPVAAEEDEPGSRLRRRAEAAIPRHVRNGKLALATPQSAANLNMSCSEAGGPMRLFLRHLGVRSRHLEIEPPAILELVRVDIHANPEPVIETKRSRNCEGLSRCAMLDTGDQSEMRKKECPAA